MMKTWQMWLNAQSLPKLIILYLLISVGIVSFGLVVGVSVVLFPPLFGIGLVSLAVVILAWVRPDAKWVPEKLLRQSFYVFLVVELCVPGFYAAQLPGLPWISARRATQFVMIILFLLVVSGSREAREKISMRLWRDKALGICAIGFLVSLVASVFTSAAPAESISGLSDVILHWYVPCFVCILIVDSEEQIGYLFVLIAFCSIFVSLMGVAEFVLKHRFVFDLFPRAMLAQMVADNPSFAKMLYANPYRNGLYRASSIFTTALGYAEFCAMAAPVGLYLMVYGATWRHRILGVGVVFLVLVSFVVSGARGGMIAFLVSTPVLVGLAVVRSARFRPKSLLAPLGVILLMMGVVGLAGAVEFVGKVHNTVLGGSDTQSSSEDRIIEWRLAVPKIEANPVTGHGLNMGADVVGFATAGGFSTLDSYVISLLVECGVPGFLTFFGMIAFGMGKGARKYLLDRTVAGALGGVMFCAVLAYGINRTVLSQRENHSLFFVYVAILILLTVGDRQPTEAQKRRLPNETSVDGKDANHTHG
jgi:O-antigen ligase